MSIHIRPDETAAALAAAGRVEDVYDAAGQLIGRFTPAPRPGMAFPEFGVTDEELDRIESDPNMKWHTPDEVMARLREIDRCSN